MFYPTFIDINLNKTETFRIYYFLYTDFGQSLTGNILNFSTYAIRDLLILLLQSCLNIMSVVFLKRHLKNKSQILYHNSSNKPTSNGDSNITLSTQIVKNISKADQNLSIMVIILTILSSFEHLFLISAVIIYGYVKNETTFLFTLASDFSVTI